MAYAASLKCLKYQRDVLNILSDVKRFRLCIMTSIIVTKYLVILQGRKRMRRESRHTYSCDLQSNISATEAADSVDGHMTARKR